MARVEVQPDRSLPLLQDPPPHPRRGGDVEPTWPLVVAEQHRAVLEGDPASVVLRVADDVRPDAQGLRPVVVLILRAVTAHERIHQRDVHQLGRVDHLLEVRDDRRPVLRVRMERIRVEAEAGDREALGLDLCPDIPGLRRRQVRDVDMAGARVPARRAVAPRPARDLEDLEALRGGPLRHFRQRGLRERGGQEAELHRGCSPTFRRVVIGRPPPRCSCARSRRSRR